MISIPSRGWWLACDGWMNIRVLWGGGWGGGEWKRLACDG